MQPVYVVLSLNQMVQYQPASLDATFAALADATRRGVVEQLLRSEASVGELAGRFGMTVTGMKKHIGVLERAGLVESEKVGRVRTCRIGALRLEAEMDWLSRHRALWAERFAALDAVVAGLEAKE